MRLLSLICLLFISTIVDLNGQTDCATAVDLCDGLSVPSLNGSGSPDNPSSCSCLATNEHDSYWMTFECIVGGTFEMMITPNNLDADFDYALFADNCPCTGSSVISCDYTGPISPPGPFVPTGISSTPMATFGVPGTSEFNPTVTLTTGTTYYIIADNITSNGVGFSIETAGTAILSTSGDIVSPLSITGESTACPGADIFFTSETNPDLDDYQWELFPPLATITNNGSEDVSVNFPIPGDYQICVTGYGSCIFSEQECFAISVEPIPPTNDEDFICIGDSYTAANGQVLFGPGVYPLIFESALGCDSTVILNLLPLPLDVEVVQDQICSGECYEYNGVEYCEAGTYEETLTNIYGCDSIITLILIEFPIDIVVTPDPPDFIDCNNTSVFLDGSLSVTNGDPTYEWLDESGGTVGFDPFLEVFSGGMYTLVVTDESGCTSTMEVFVDEDSSEPDVFATGGTIDCINSSILIQGSSSVNGVFYQWTGPNGFFSNEANPFVEDPGTYNLLVTAPNGCTAETTAEVIDDSTSPNISATGGEIDCDNTTISIVGTSDINGSSFEWTGPNGFFSLDQSTSVLDPGTYNLIVTAPNGCTAEEIAIVTGDTNPPDISTTGAILDCSGNAVTVSGNSTTPNVTYNWTGPGGFSSIEQNPQVTEVGTYLLIVTGLNGCTSEMTADVVADTDVPDVSAIGGTIDCINPMLNLEGNSNTPDVSYEWTGPNSFSSTEQSPEVTAPGTYTLVVSAPNGCTSTANAVVMDNAQDPDISTTSTTLTCEIPNSNISGNSMTPDVTYTWTGPNGFSSNESSPEVNEGGTYTLVVLAPNGCTSEESIEVVSDQNNPDISASGGEIDCLNLEISLSGNSNTADVTYTWTGPNGFNSNEQNPMVTEQGAYTLTILATNGCTSSLEVQVTEDTMDPDISAAGGTIDCNNPTINLQGGSNTADVTYTWTGPNGFSSNEQNPEVDGSGTYELVIIATNGCSSNLEVQVIEDVDIPDISVAGGTVDCTDPTLTITGNSSADNVTYAWTGPNSFSSTEQNPEITDPGEYTLVVSTPNGCTNSDIAVVIQDAEFPVVQTTGGTLNCNETSIILTASSDIEDVTYSWSGPNNFSSDEQNPTVDVMGDYTVVVTATNGCSTESMALVEEDFVEPGATATGGILTCTIGSISIVGSTNTANTTIEWTGPGGFSSNELEPQINQAGTYTLTITGQNGCTSEAIALVELDGDVPEVFATGGTINCINLDVQIEGMSPTDSVTYNWQGPNGFTSNEINPIVTDPGDYILVVTAPNNCTSSATAVVLEDNDDPFLEVSNGLINCDITAIALESNTNDPDLTFEWTGPNGFSSNETMPVVDVGGIYDLMVTANNGCTSMASIEITEDIASPDVSAIGSILDCNNPNITIEGNSMTPDVTYAWTGPNSFASDEQNPEITDPGTYVLEVTALNGCKNTFELEIVGDFETPDIQTTGGTIDCQTTSIILGATSNTTDISYSWSGPNSFASTEQNPEVVDGGDYVLTVTGLNGCTSISTANIQIDNSDPEIQAEGGTLNCIDTQIQLSGSSTTDNVSYAWTGPNGFSSDESSPNTSEAGSYTLIVTAANFCTSSAEVMVNEDIEEPDISGQGGTIDCSSTSIVINANSLTENVDYSWEAPDGSIINMQNPEVSLIGDYTLTVTAANGCTSTLIVPVLQDADVPDVQALGGNIDCSNPTIQLSGTSQTPGVTYSWEFPDGTTVMEQNPIADQAGSYTLVVTAANGCEASTGVMVSGDFAEPNASSENVIISCDNPSVQLIGNSSTPNATFTWTGPNGFNSDEQNPTISEAGTYTLTVTGPNGCTNSSQSTAALDADVPVATAIGGTLDCDNGNVILSGSSSVNGSSLEWTGPGGFNSNDANPSVDLAGTYTLVITAPNGCSATASALVGEDFEAPNIAISTPDEFFCNTIEVTIDASNSDSGPEYSYNWTTNDGQINSGGSSLTPSVGTIGDYTITIENNSNGCTATESVQITESDEVPSDVELVISDPECFGEANGSIYIESVIGGQAPYEYSINGETPTTNPQFAFLAAGTYNILVVDGGGCEFVTTVLINEPAELDVQIEVLNEKEQFNLGETIELEAVVTNPSSNITSIIWTPTDGFDEDCLDCLTPTITALFSGSYEVQVEDENGCIATDRIDLFVNRERPVYVPNVFSPNDDGINDVLTVLGGPSVTNIKSFLIFNRWGETVYQYYNFLPNDITIGWDGTSRGEALNPDVYVYFVEAEFIDGKSQIFKGDVAIIK